MSKNNEERDIKNNKNPNIKQRKVYIYNTILLKVLLRLSDSQIPSAINVEIHGIINKR